MVNKFIPRVTPVWAIPVSSQTCFRVTKELWKDFICDFVYIWQLAFKILQIVTDDDNNMNQKLQNFVTYPLFSKQSKHMCMRKKNHETIKW